MAMTDTSSRSVSMEDTQRMREKKEDGLLEKGNIDIHNRPVVKRDNGKYSTVDTIGVGIGEGREANIPRISKDGRVMSNKEAIENFKKTHEHLGIYKDRDSAARAAQKLHKDQEKEYLGGK